MPKAKTKYPTMMWALAKEIYEDKGDMSWPPTVEELQQIIYEKSDCSPYCIFTSVAAWIERDNCLEDYLSRYFFNVAEVLLAYIMAVYHAKFWDGNDWKCVSSWKD